MPLQLTPQTPPYYEQTADGGSSKIYIALLSQTGTAAPTAIILNQTPNFTITWTRNAAGQYFGEINQNVVINKTAITITQNAATGYILCYLTDVNTIELQTFNTTPTNADDKLSLTPIEIKVYN